jgi:hypothetical protein
MKTILLGTKKNLIEETLLNFSEKPIIYSTDGNFLPLDSSWTIQNYKNKIFEIHGPCLILEEGEQVFENIPEETSRIYVINNEVMSKEARVLYSPVNDLEEVNLPLSECFIIKNKSSEFSDYMQDRYIENNKFASDALYYSAFKKLKEKKYKEFISLAEEFLFKSKESMAKNMCHYYCASVYLAVNEIERAIGHATYMLSEFMLSAEAWCILGDAFLKLSQPFRAMYFYDNAIFLGSKRKKDDGYPIEIKKYKEYPKEKMKECERLLGFNQ